MAAERPFDGMTRYRLRRAGLIIRLGGECAGCGAVRHLQFHHVEGNGDSHGIGGSIQLLCKKCHRKEHDNLHLGELPGGYRPPEGGEI